MTIKALNATLEDRVRILEDANGWNRDLGVHQLHEYAGEWTHYEFGRFAQLVDLLEELSFDLPGKMGPGTSWLSRDRDQSGRLPIPSGGRDYYPQLLCIDISGVVVLREPAGRGWQAHVEGNPGHWSRGDSQDEAVGSLIRRLAVEHEGANYRREMGK